MLIDSAYYSNMGEGSKEVVSRLGLTSCIMAQPLPIKATRHLKLFITSIHIGQKSP